MVTCQILIVDDDPDDIDILRTSFSEIGVKEVDGVESMRGAIAFLQSIADPNNLPKIIITDLNMPGQNGYDLLKCLKASAQFQHIPVIVFSTSLSNKEKEVSLSLGALDYIPKPILVEDYTDVAIKINEIIEKGI